MTVCTVGDCGRPVQSRKMCKAHYFRWYRTGSPGSAEIWDRVPRPCTVEGCGEAKFASGLCSLHYQRLKNHGDISHVTPKPVGDEHHNWLGDDVGYTGAHDRVRALHGSASTHLCVNCGGKARHWAYNHLDPNEKLGPRPYSVDPAYYQAMCVQCHKRMDMKFLAKTP